MKTKTLISMLLILVLAGCKKSKKSNPEPETPVADFSYIISSTEPGKVSFTNLSQNSTSTAWNFGNGMSSNEASPTIIFTQGTYKVSLTVNSGVTMEKTIQIDNAYYFTTRSYTAHTVSGQIIGPNIRIATRRLTNDLGGNWDNDFNFDITFPKTAQAGTTYTISTNQNPLWFHYYYLTTAVSVGPTTANFENEMMGTYLKVSEISATEVAGTFSCVMGPGVATPPKVIEGRFKAKLK